jgi:hypothetical protein
MHNDVCDDDSIEVSDRSRHEMNGAPKGNSQS